MENFIERQIEMKASPARVWKALTDHKEFGAWFRVKIEKPFEVGKESKGNILYPGYEHVVWRVVIKEMKPEKLFSFTWHPYAVDPAVDYSKETPTLVEFKLSKTETGTLLVVRESGFDKIPAHRQIEAIRMNSGGWSEQMQNISTYVKEHP